MSANVHADYLIYKSKELDVCKATEIAFIGDVALAGDVGKAIDEHGVEFPFQLIKDTAFDSDFIVFNLECCISDRGGRWEPKPVALRGQPHYLEVFPKNGKEYIANLANNHFLDYGDLAALDTINALNKVGMKYIGAHGKEISQQPRIIHTSNGRIALISYAPCAHPLPGDPLVNVAAKEIGALKRDVENAKKDADVVIVSLHQGVEFSRYADKSSRRVARAIIDAGGDLVIAHHTHLIQGYERYKEGSIFYGIGNFLIKLDSGKRPDTKYSLMVNVSIHNGRIHNISIRPFVITNDLQVVYPGSEENEYVVNKFRYLSHLLSSKYGRIINDWYVLLFWIGLHSSSLLEMIQREGIIRAVRYYSGRVIAKIGLAPIKR